MDLFGITTHLNHLLRRWLLVTCHRPRWGLSGSTADLGTHEGFQLKKGEIPGRSAKISIQWFPGGKNTGKYQLY